MSEDLVINVNANTAQANAALDKTKEAVKKVGDEAVNTTAKSKSSFDGLSKNLIPAAAAFLAFKLAVRGIRTALNELDDASKEDSLVSGKLKEAAIVASESVKNLGLTFEKFKQTAASALAPVIGYMAKDLSDAINGTTKDMQDNAETVNELATGYAVLKTVLGVVGGTFQLVFGAMQAAIADVLIIVGKLAQGFGFLAGVISKDLGDSIKSFGDTMVASADAVGDKALANLAASGKKLGAAFSGAMFDETMKGFDKYKSAIADKAEEISVMDKAMKKVEELLKLKKESSEIARKDLEEYRKKLPEMMVEAEIEQKIYNIKAAQRKERWEQHLINVEDSRILELNNLLENEKWKAIKKQVEEQEKLVAANAATSEARNANYLEKTGKLVSGEESASSMKINQTPTEIDYFKSRMELEMEFYASSVENANAYANEILAIDDYMNGTIQQQEGRRRAQELIAEKKNAQLKQMTWQEAANGISGALGNLAVLMQSKNKQLFEIGRAAALAQNVVDTIQSAASSYAFGSRLGGPILGAAFAATAVVAGAVRASQLMSAQPSGGGNVGGGYTDTGNIGGPGGQTSGAGVGASSQVNVSLYGERFGADQVRGLIDAINAETKDGKKVTVKV